MSLEDRSFAGPSAVGQYWIAHSEGFGVESQAGGALGRIEAVEVDPRTAEPVLVLARPALLGVRLEVVAARRVVSVLPWSRRLVLARGAKAGRSRRLGAAGVKAKPYVVAAFVVAGAGVRRWATLVARALRAYAVRASLAAPPVARAARTWLVRGLAAVRNDVREFSLRR